MSSVPLHYRFTGIPRSGTAAPSVTAVPGTPRKTRIPVPVTPQAQAKAVATPYQDTNLLSTFRKAKAIKPIKSAARVSTLFTSTEAGESSASSAVNATQSLDTTTVHSKYERFEEFVDFQKKHPRNEDNADSMAINNKYRRIEGSGSYSGRTRLPVPSSYTMKTPKTPKTTYELRDAYTADMANSTVRQLPNSQMSGSDTMFTFPTTDLGTDYYAGLSTPLHTRGKRLPKMAKPTNTHGNRAKMSNNNSISNTNSSTGLYNGTSKHQPAWPSTPKCKAVMTPVDNFISPYQLPSPLMPNIQGPGTPKSKFVKYTSTPLDYDKIPQKTTVINGIKRSVGYDERFPILKRVRKNNPPVDECSAICDEDTVMDG
ncbi:hypothetical protein L211DRAFT_845783 [Terfezia boudieri ATCC MYA-4762]|uniref:Uncharacterized protein n=1 Tax=Terfezia boudieri ATCC MYA-4762 TaxID=1051890 RepID=A0A3N4LXZ1_9PEZI|nr:hypothetical protein L211DRAFT_845783 [Terfezia boudieri ATCC MYA-4762]